MQRYEVVYTSEFKANLDTILDFIGDDNPKAAAKFGNELLDKIDTLDFMPFRCRQHLDNGDKNIRDLVFKGYVIVFRVIENEVRILGIYKENLWNFQADVE